MWRFTRTIIRHQQQSGPIVHRLVLPNYEKLVPHSCTCQVPSSSFRSDVRLAACPFSTPATSTKPAPTTAAKKGGSNAPLKKKEKSSSKHNIINIAQTLQIPSPASHTAPFPSQANSNDQRPWRPYQGGAAGGASGTTPGPTLLTTPIFYANGVGHIGHLSTTLLMDALNRWNNLSAPPSSSHTRSSWLISGTDEHGTKVAEAAAKHNMSPADYVRQISLSFHTLFTRAHIHLDDYIRTTEKRHQEIVQTVWSILHEKGYIYLGQHSGYYSRVDECFIPEGQLEKRTDQAGVETLHDRETGNRVEYQSEKNYKFRLSAFRDILIQWIETTEPAVIEPLTRKNEILGFLKSTPLEDISVSRLKTKLQWGISLPPSTVVATEGVNANSSNEELPESLDEYQSHVIYVWLDALINYLTLSGITSTQLRNLDQLSTAASSERPLWPPSVQVIGKDILRFHTIYWPAFLLALNLPSWKEAKKDTPTNQLLLSPEEFTQLRLQLPRRIIAHGHWLVDRIKMSKSLGNVVDPNALITDFGVDSIRYSLLRDSQLADDSNFSAADVINRFHADLNNTLGNLLSRCIGSALLPENALPKIDPDMLAKHPYSANELELINELDSLPSKLHPLISSLKFGEALNLIFTFLYSINAYVHTIAPWSIRKEIRRLADLPTRTASDTEQIGVLEHSVAKTLYLCLESLRCVGILLQPIIPESMNKLLWRLAVPENERRLKHARFGRPSVPFPSISPSSTSSPIDSSTNSTTSSATTFILFQTFPPDRVLELLRTYDKELPLEFALPSSGTNSSSGGGEKATKKETTTKPSKQNRKTRPVA